MEQQLSDSQKFQKNSRKRWSNADKRRQTKKFLTTNGINYINDEDSGNYYRKTLSTTETDKHCEEEIQ